MVEPTDIDGITRALERWLTLAPAERDAFATRAARYMHEHLSMAAAIERRLRLWSERMPA